MHTHPDALVGRTGERIAEKLDEVTALFKPGAVVTLVVQMMDSDATLVVTSGTIPGAISALQHQLVSGTVQYADVVAGD